MATKNPPVKNAAFTFRIVLFAQSDNQIKTTPTIAAGDFKVSIDGGALANPGTLPSESPASSGQVLITLTADEMNGDEIVVRWIDASGDEWHSGAVVLHTIASGQQFDQLATAAALAAGVTVASNGITAASIASNAITSAKIATSAISSAKIASNAIDSTKIASGALTSAAFASGAITQSAIAAGTLIDSKFGSGAITADILAADAAAEIADAVWDEAMADHVTAGTTGNALYNAYLNVTTVLARLGAFTGTGVNTVIGFFQALMRSDATTPSDVGGTYDDETDSLQAIRDQGDAAWTGSTAAAVADAVWDEAIAGHVSAGSTGAALNSIDADEIVDALEAALAAVSSVTVVATVAGATATVYQYATWEAQFSLSGTPGLTAYDLIFAVKRYPSDLDAESVLYVNSATGLIYIGQAAATGASYGSLTADSATEFTVYVDAAEVVAKIASNFGGAHTWTLKGIETDTTPDEAIVIATGTWRIEPGYVRSLT